MNLNDDIVPRRLRFRRLHQLHPSRSRGLICPRDRIVPD
jgi:hypothetical protein